MAKQHIVFLTEQEIKDMLNVCRVVNDFADTFPYFDQLQESSQSVFKKLLAKRAEIEADRK